MNVLICLSDDRIGGPQRASAAVADVLFERGIDTEFLLPGRPNRSTATDFWEGYTVHQPGVHRLHPPTNIVENGKTVAAAPFDLMKIQRIIHQRDIDVVHARQSAAIHGALAASTTNTPVIWHFNDTSLPTPVATFLARLSRLLADKIVVASQDVHEYFFPESVATQTLYAPVDTTRYDPAKIEAPSELGTGINLDWPVVLAVGNLNPIKGFDHLLHAIRIVVDETGPVTCLIAGKPLESQQSYAQQLFKLKKELKLDDYVHFLGFRDDVPELLALADVFVLSSVAEACSIAVLEAMAMEKPIVATEVGGVREQLPSSEHGWRVNPEDPDALAAGISKALEHPDVAEKKASRVREQAKENFSINAVANEYEKLYNRTVLK